MKVEGGRASSPREASASLPYSGAEAPRGLKSAVRGWDGSISIHPRVAPRRPNLSYSYPRESACIGSQIIPRHPPHPPFRDSAPQPQLALPKLRRLRRVLLLRPLPPLPTYPPRPDHHPPDPDPTPHRSPLATARPFPFLEHPPTPAQKRGLTTLSPTQTPSTADTTTPVDRAVCPLFWNAPSECLPMSVDFHASA